MQCLPSAKALFPKTLQVLRELRRERQVACIEAFDLIDAGAGILGEIEDVHLALRENDPHANRRMTKAIDRPLGLKNGIQVAT